MGIYQEFEMLTIGNVPTMKVETPVSIPIPFFPPWAKWVIGALVVVGGVLVWLWLQSDADKTKNVAEIERLKKEGLKKSETIAQLQTPQPQTPYGNDLKSI